jgi:CRP-like cAMP-binding protein
VTPQRNRAEHLSPQQSHGLKALKRAVSTLGRRTIDRRIRVGQQLAAWGAEIIADLGGVDLALANKVIAEQASTSRYAAG